MGLAPLTRRSTLRDLYRRPVGRDVVDKLLLQLGLPARALAAVGWVRLGWLDRIGRRWTGPGLVDSLIELVDAEPDLPLDGPAPDPPPWWREAVIYQVYPRSFADSDGDGIGDLRGVIDHLDELADLAVDCLWLSPIFASPNEDMGYDVSDYRGVMTEMGTLEDVDELVAGCHDRGIRVVLDLVVNHTSQEHPWFRAAVADPDGPFGRWYFLRGDDPEHPPNNWRSFFSGPAWRWIPEARRWAMHLFAPGQMDLDWTNPEVRDEVADIVRWWMRRGVDGFRLDVINYISKPDSLPDGHPFVGELLEFTGIEHYFYGPRLHEHLRELRRDGFTRREPPASTPRRRLPDGTLGDPLPPDPVGLMVGETPGIGRQLGRMLSGHGRDELDLVLNFDVLETPGHTRWDNYAYDPRYLKQFFRAYDAAITANDWVAVFLDNHDNPRMLSKIAAGRERDPATRTAIGTMLATLQLTMRGTPFLYQGQEIGAVDQDFTSVEQLRDVESHNRWAALLADGATPEAAWAEVLPGTRDHARVPMRWDRSGGFTTGSPWLAGTDTAKGFSVAEQRADPGSVWHRHRELIALRRAHRALTVGDLEWVHPAHPTYMAYARRLGEEAFLVEINLSGSRLTRPTLPWPVEPVVGGPRGRTMAPWESTVGRIG